jgi:hypothetical protein
LFSHFKNNFFQIAKIFNNNF